MAYTSEDIEIKSLSVLKEKMDNTLSAAQEFRDALYGNLVELVFNTVGGNSIPNRVVYKNQSYGILPVPYKPGYDFAGWFLSMTVNNDTRFYSNQVLNMTKVSTSKPKLTLYAKWEPSYIEFDLDANGGIVEPDTISVRYLDYFGTAYQGPGKPTGLPIPTHLYNSFEYWSSDPPRLETNYRGTNRIASETTNVYVKNMTLYANWRNVDFYIYYDVNGGRGGDNLEPQKAENLKENTLSTVAQVGNKITRDGYVLKGFTDIKGSSEPKTEVFVDNRSVTVYAIWARERYRLSYYISAGSELLQPTEESGNHNPQDVLLDWIDYLNFVDEYRFTENLGTYFARWTTPPAGQTGHNPWVANLKPEDGDILWNYNLAKSGSTSPKGDTTLLPIPERDVPHSVLVEVGVTQNPLSNIPLSNAMHHGDSLSIYQFNSDAVKNFVMSAKIQSTVDKENGKYKTTILQNLKGESIRVYPRQARYYKPTRSDQLSNSFVAVSFAYNMRMEGVKVPITVKKSLTRIELIDPPKKTVYMNGSSVDTTGLKLSVIYSDGVESEVIYFDTNTLQKGIVKCSMEANAPNKSQVSRKLSTLHVSATYDGRTKTLPPIAFTVNLSSTPRLIWDAGPDYHSPPFVTVLENAAGSVLSVFTGKPENLTEGYYRGGYEPDGEPVCVDQYNLIRNLSVYAYYPNEDATLCPDGWDRKDRLYDYYFSPSEISEKIMKSWPYKSSTSLTANDKTGRIAYLSIYWRAWYQNRTISTTVPVSVFPPFGIDHLTLMSSISISDVDWSSSLLSSVSTSARAENIQYKADHEFTHDGKRYGTLRLSGIIVRIPHDDEVNGAGWTDPTKDPIFGAWRLTGTYNRPNSETVELRLSDCSVTPSTIDLATTKVTAVFDYASVTVHVRPTLPGSCYCGFIEVNPKIVRARPENATPVFLPQAFTPDDAGITKDDKLYYYNYSGTKYLRYYVATTGSDLEDESTERDVNIVTRRSTGDAEGITMPEYNRLIHTTSNVDGARISIFYTNPNTVLQWNSPLTRANCRGTSSFITRIDIAPVRYTYVPETFNGKTYQYQVDYEKNLDGTKKSDKAKPVSSRNNSYGLPGYFEDTFLEGVAVGGLTKLSAMRYVCYYQTKLENFYIKNPMNLRHGAIEKWWNEHPHYCDHPLREQLKKTSGSGPSKMFLCCYADTERRYICKAGWPYFHDNQNKTFAQLSGRSPVAEVNFYMVEIGRKCFTSCINLDFGFLMQDDSISSYRVNRANANKYSTREIFFLPASVRRIGYAAFAYCNTMKELWLQNGNDTFETYDFRNYNDHKFKISGGVYSGDPEGDNGIARTIISSERYGYTIHRLSSIESRAFYSCQNLVTVDSAIFGRYIKDEGTSMNNCVLTHANRYLSTVGEDVFRGCTKLTGLRLGEISHISAKAFYGCVNLKKITWPQRIEMSVSWDYTYPGHTSLNYSYHPASPSHNLRNFSKMSTDKPFGIGSNDDESKITFDIYRSVSMDSYFDGGKIQKKVMSNRDKDVTKNKTWKVYYDSTFNVKFHKCSSASNDESKITGSMSSITNKFRGYDFITLPKCAFKWKGHTFKGWKWSNTTGAGAITALSVEAANGTRTKITQNTKLADKAKFTVANGAVVSTSSTTLDLSAVWDPAK